VEWLQPPGIDFRNVKEESKGPEEARINREKAMEAKATWTTAPIIHLVDDDESFQIAMSRLLQAAGYRVRSYANAGEFLLANFDETPGCILLDVRMPGPSGLELQRALTAGPSPLPIIFLSGYDDIPTTVRAIKGGAVDFLTKPVEGEVLLCAIQNALATHARNRLVHEQRRKLYACHAKLTARESEVFERVVAGKMNKEIASELGAAERTVKAHRARVMEKMGAASLAQLVHFADQLQIGVAKPPAPGPQG
jgi:FixJ family two-component response regulator